MFRVGCPKVCSAWNKLIAKVMNILWPLHCRLFPNNKGVNKERRNMKVIVSMTSFPARFDTLQLCIESVMRQSYRPDSIVLWLAKSDLCVGGVEIPAKVYELEKYGLQIKFAEKDLKPHKN